MSKAAFANTNVSDWISSLQPASQSNEQPKPIKSVLFFRDCEEFLNGIEVTELDTIPGELLSVFDSGEFSCR